jgi:hypothetical protein
MMRGVLKQSPYRMNFHLYSYCVLISALIVYLLCENVKRALSSGPLVREALVWLMPGTADGHHQLALRRRAVLFGKSAFGP